MQGTTVIVIGAGPAGLAAAAALKRARVPVLVVGAGCTGVEIAYDLAEGGARRVRLAVRTPPNMLLRTPIGPALARLVARLPAERADAVMRFARRRTIGDLSEFGLPIPEEG